LDFHSSRISSLGSKIAIKGVKSMTVYAGAPGSPAFSALLYVFHGSKHGLIKGGQKK
jgi:hypothetical protein